MGKTWLACALASQACRMGRSAYYVRLPRMLDELAIGRADGRYMKLLKHLAKIDVLVIDDWGLAVLVRIPANVTAHSGERDRCA